MSLQFDWDAEKARSKSAKHNITFEEAATVFRDPLAVIFDDEAHSLDETREVIIGHSERNRLILVAFVERAGSVRIISARQTTKRERMSYEEHIERCHCKQAVG